jgi:hypothetical protein
MLLLTSCPDDDPVKPVDLCEGKIPVTAKFTVKQQVLDMIGSNPINIETDSVLSFRTITLEAEGDYESYEWQLVDDPRIKTGKKITYYFMQTWGRLNMRLVVKNKIDSLCFPYDDGIDTITKPIYVIDRKYVSIQGSYSGYDVSEPKDTFTVDIKYEGDDRGIVIYNINRGCILPAYIHGNNIANDYANHFIIFNGGSDYSFGCTSPKGTAILQPDMKSIIIEYEAGLEKERVKYKFIGVKK